MPNYWDKILFIHMLIILFIKITPMFCWKQVRKENDFTLIFLKC